MSTVTLSRTLAFASLSLTLVACAKQPVPITDGSTSGPGPTSSGDGDGDATGTDTDDPPPDACVDALDILIVMDNSGSMGANQRRFADAIPALLAPLEQHGVDWRIGVTTTDSGNQWCPPGQTTPENGALVASSCTTRLGDFLFDNGVSNVQGEVCNDICDGPVEFLATATAVDPVPAERPWVESIGGQLNIAGGLTATAALRCLVPMGINGCGFESPLESNYLALNRMRSEGEDSYGFLRATASLLVIIVSDEVDCSDNPDWSEIFDSNGNQEFWSDPNAAFPTSAVCWNAGVTCTGGPGTYASCDPINKDVNGGLGASDADAVLYPLSRYTEGLDALEAEKRALSPMASVRVGLIGGVGQSGALLYADVEETDPQFQNAFGIGPGCSAPNPSDPDEPHEAVPPVRMRDVVLTSGGALGSICASQFDASMTAMVQPFVSECG